MTMVVIPVKVTDVKGEGRSVGRSQGARAQVESDVIGLGFDVDA